MNDHEEQVILVDREDKEIAVKDKLPAHKDGNLHRAFSIFLFNKKGQLLLQHRAKEKYHGGNLWTNTTCGHPRPQESTADAAHRRLREEMGIDCSLTHFDEMIYQADISNGLTEHEYLHLFVGRFEGHPKIDPAEASGYRWIDWPDLLKDMADYPELYTPWFRIVFAAKEASLKQQIS